MTDANDSVRPSGGGRGKWVAAAFVVALALRIVAGTLASGDELPGLTTWYVRLAATMASGHGLIMRSRLSATAPDEGEGSNAGVAFMRQRQAEGGRVDADHPYPQDVTGWLPVTMRPAGYPVLLYLLYRAGNYDGMVLGIRLAQALADALVCVLLFLFARNVFSPRVGLAAAWVYALLPSAMVSSMAMLLPDAFAMFLMALVLCLASYARVGRGWMLIPTGLAIGLACQFRPEFLLLPVVVFMILWAWRRRFWSTLGWSAAMAAAFLLTMTPWMMWTQRATGKAMLSTSNGGGSMYEALGEDPHNPFGVVLDDRWVEQDAVNRGFTSAWSAAANDCYYKKFKECVLSHPAYYAKLVLVNRLPLALVPPFNVREKTAKEKAAEEDFSFAKIARQEGLTRWGVIAKYPGTVIRVFWREMTMVVVSAILLLAFVAANVARWRQWREQVWLVLPWAYVIAGICLTKQVDPRNVSSNLVVAAVALGMVVVWFVDPRRRRAAAKSAGPAVTAGEGHPFRGECSRGRTS